jgi:hypothetical protein
MVAVKPVFNFLKLSTVLPLRLFLTRPPALQDLKAIKTITRAIMNPSSPSAPTRVIVISGMLNSLAFELKYVRQAQRPHCARNQCSSS